MIFNIGATCSSIAALQNRFDVSGLKMAFNYFQAAAGLFQYINDNFLHAPSVDMSRDSIKCLVDLMLAQAQECFIEKVLLEKKKGTLVAKLASQLAFLYATTCDGFSSASLAGQFDKTWGELVKVKAKYFSAMAYCHRAMQAEADGEFGQVVAFLEGAESVSKDACKLALSFSNAFPRFTVSSEASSPSTVSTLLMGGGPKTSDSAALSDAANALSKLIAERKALAIKDNDIIYHAVVPDLDTLPPIQKLNAVKTIPFVDLCTNGQAEISRIIGPDTFHALVPLSVHEASSMYSEEKAKVLRHEQERLKEADENLQALFDSMNLVPVMERLRKLLKPDALSTRPELPSHMLDIAQSVASQEQDRTSIQYIRSVIENVKQRTKKSIDDLNVMLDAEQYECENLRVKYMDLWIQEPSFKLSAPMRQELRDCQDKLNRASETDKSLWAKIESISPFLELFKTSVENVQTQFVRSVVGNVSSADKDHPRASLIDEDVDKNDGLGILGEQIIIEKLDATLNRLKSLKKERLDLVEELKKKLHEDDISSLLLLNGSREQQVIVSELLKFRPIQTKIDGNLATQSQLLQDISTEFNKLCSTSQGMKTQEAREKRRVDILTNWQSSFDTYQEVKTSLSDGLDFYNKLVNVSETQLKGKVTDFINDRSAERQRLINRIDAQHSERNQKALRDQLERLKVSSAPQNVAAPIQQSPSTQQSIPASFPTQQAPRPDPNASHAYGNVPYSLAQAPNALPASPNQQHFTSQAQVPQLSTQATSQPPFAPPSPIDGYQRPHPYQQQSSELSQTTLPLQRPPPQFLPQHPMPYASGFPTTQAPPVYQQPPVRPHHDAYNVYGNAGPNYQYQPQPTSQVRPPSSVGSSALEASLPPPVEPPKMPHVSGVTQSHYNPPSTQPPINYGSYRPYSQPPPNIGYYGNSAQQNYGQAPTGYNVGGFAPPSYGQQPPNYHPAYPPSTAPYNTYGQPPPQQQPMYGNQQPPYGQAPYGIAATGQQQQYGYQQPYSQPQNAMYMQPGFQTSNPAVYNASNASNASGQFQQPAELQKRPSLMD